MALEDVIGDHFGTIVLEDTPGLLPGLDACLVLCDVIAELFLGDGLLVGDAFPEDVDAYLGLKGRDVPVSGCEGSLRVCGCQDL